MQNNVGNKFSHSTIVCPITSKMTKSNIPTHQVLMPEDGVKSPSIALCEQLRTIDKSRLIKRLGSIKAETLKEINNKMLISLGIEG